MKPTHRYIGPTTRWGLHTGAKVKPGKGMGGLVVCRTSDGRSWLCLRSQLERLR